MDFKDKRQWPKQAVKTVKKVKMKKKPILKRINNCSFKVRIENFRKANS